MAKKASKTQAASVESISAAPALKKTFSAARAPKHVKAKVAAVAAAVEGFVTAVINPAETEVRKEAGPAGVKANSDLNKTEKSPKAAAAKKSAALAEPVNAVIVDQTVAELSRPGVEAEPVALTQEAISKLAYQFYLDRNGQGGSMADDWFRAEQALRAGALT